MIQVAIRKGLMKLVRQMVAAAISKIKGESGKVEGIINSLSGNFMRDLESWKGDDAEAFRAEIETRLKPQLEQLKNTILQISTNLGKAETCIVDADTRATSEVQKLSDLFRNIYR